MKSHEFEQMLQYRLAAADAVQNHLPQLIRVPVPSLVAQAPWFEESGIADILDPWAAPNYEIPGFSSGKALAAFSICMAHERDEDFAIRPTVIAPTSGNLGDAMAELLTSPRKAFDVAGLITVIDKKTPLAKQQALRDLGAEVVIPPDGIIPTVYADMLGKQPGMLVINQYTDWANVEAQQYLARHIYRSLGSKIACFVVVTGSTASYVGLDRYLGELVPGVKAIGVASMNDDEKVPGSRTKAGLSVSGFGYQSVVDRNYPLVEDISLRVAMATSYEMITVHGINAGPTPGLCVAGGYSLLEREYRAGRLDALKNSEGRIPVVFVFMDGPGRYADTYQETLGVEV